MVNNFGHGTWTREGGQVLNDTPEKLYQRVTFFLHPSSLRDTVALI